MTWQEDTGNGHENILFITLSNIGDAVMTTPVLQTLHRIYPRAVIDMVVDKRSRDLFVHCPYRGELFEKDKQAFMRGFPRLVFRLARKRYRLAVDLRTDGLLCLIRAGKKLGKWNGDASATHAVEKHLSVVRTLAGDKSVYHCCLWPGDEDFRFAGRMLEQVKSKKTLCIAPGANAAKKIWSWKSFRELINRIDRDFDSVVLLGSRRDRPIAEEITAGINLQALNLCGETSLLQAAAILAHASLFIGNDSGLGHMAAAAGAPTCTLFGPGQPEKYRPWGDAAVWLTGRNRQVNDISVDDVIRHLELNRLLA